MTADEIVKIIEAAAQVGVARLKLADLEVEFRQAGPPLPRDVAPAPTIHLAMEPGKPLCGIPYPRALANDRSCVTCEACLALMRGETPVDDPPPSEPITAPGKGHLCHCGHHRAIEHNDLGCLLGCDEAQCRGEEQASE